MTSQSDDVTFSVGEKTTNQRNNYSIVVLLLCRWRRRKMREAKGNAKMGRRRLRERVYIFIDIKRAISIIRVQCSKHAELWNLTRFNFQVFDIRKLDLISSLNVTETCSVMSGVSITTGTKSTGPDTEKKINICDTQLGQCQKAIMVSFWMDRRSVFDLLLGHQCWLSDLFSHQDHDFLQKPKFFNFSLDVDYNSF